MTKTPFERAQQIWQREECRYPFAEVLWWHHENGVVISRPDVFIMGRPVLRLAAYADITNPAVVFDEADAWWIYCASGPLAAFLALEPYPLPFIGWERRNEPRFYPRETLVRRAKIQSLKL